MDFRQCPACQASVLDDDASECPFCGASMSGKPAASPAKPAPSKPAASAKPAARPAAKPEAPVRKAPARKVGETVADEDDPFGIDTSAVAQVPGVAPKAVKGRTIRVQCPMCETPGFISARMQGRDVKCCNPNCMVPVFKAPAPPKQQEESVAKGGGMSGKALGIGAGVALLVGGLLFWGFVWMRQEGTVVETPTGSDYKWDPDLVGGNDPAPVQTEQQPPGPRTMSLADIKRQALANIITSAQARDDNQRKAFGRQLAAEAYAQAGDLKQALEQIAQLQKRSVGGNVPYFQVEPLVLIAWQQAAQGDVAAATQTIEQAGQAFQQLPQVGRQVLTSGIALASAQAAFDQIPKAQETLRQIETERERARVAAMLHIALRVETFDLDEMLKLTSLDMASEPLPLAVAIDMASHGRWEQAVAWANAQRLAGTSEDSLAALATFAGLQAVRTQQTAAVTTMESVPGLSPTAQTRIQAGLATGYLMGGDRSRAESALAKALESFATIPKPAAIEPPTMKQIHDSEGQPNAGLPDPSPLQSSAAAALQLARLQAAVDQQQAGWQTLLKAWDFTAGMASAMTPISQLVDEFDKQRSRAESKLYQQLNLRNADQQRRALNRYRGQLKVFEAASKDRFNLERSLLRNADAMGYATEVAAFRGNPGSVVASAAGQPYQQANEEDLLLAALAQAESLFSEGKYKEAAGALAEFRDRTNRGNEERRDLRAMQLGCRLLKLKKADALLKFAIDLEDDWLSEDTLELAAALSVINGLAPQVWERHERFELQPTQKVALYRGLIAGIVAQEQRQARPTQTAASE